jgi:hypothetical protein
MALAFRYKDSGIDFLVKGSKTFQVFHFHLRRSPPLATN